MNATCGRVKGSGHQFEVTVTAGDTTHRVGFNQKAEAVIAILQKKLPAAVELAMLQAVSGFDDDTRHGYMTR